MNLERNAFFDAVRNNPFGGSLTREQVAGMEAILDEWQRRGLTDLRWLAYMLATVFWETARTMQPVTEYGSAAYLRAKKYWPFIGRGLVQLTWRANYVRAGEKIGVDLVGQPERALELPISVRILFDGMIEGWFAGDRKGRHTLGRWFSETVDDPAGARRIINGTDRAKEIAAIHDRFLAALEKAADRARSETTAPTPAPAGQGALPASEAPPPAPEPAETRFARVGALVGAAIAAVAVVVAKWKGMF